MKKQNAVEWLDEQMKTHLSAQMRVDIIKQAKAMEKERAVEFGYDIADYLACDVLSKKAIENRYDEFLNLEKDGE